MGITVTVESIFPNEKTDPLIVAYKTKAAQIFVQEICKAFNWETLPWLEPAERVGTIDSSFSYTTWALALRIASSSNFPEQNQEFPYSPFYALNKEERLDWFRHFLDKDEYLNFYIPVDFDIPKHLYNEFNGNTFVVASAIRLGKEMQDLEQEVSHYMNKYGRAAVVEPNKSLAITWEYIYEFCLTLQAACKEGIELGLPVQLLY